jgi:hypothetical protein
VLSRMACLGVVNALALLRLLPMSNRDKDAEILALRHQIAVLERHLHGEKILFTAADRAFLAALLYRLPKDVLRRIRLLVRPGTVLRWHRNLIAYRHATISRPKQAARPATIRSIGRLCYVWPARTARGDTAESTANCSSSVSRSPPRPSGRSSTKPASTRHQRTNAVVRSRCGSGPAGSALPQRRGRVNAVWLAVVGGAPRCTGAVAYQFGGRDKPSAAAAQMARASSVNAVASLVAGGVSSAMS